MTIAKEKVYKERTVKTALGEVRVYFGHGRHPADYEVTFSNHTGQHAIRFCHYGCDVLIECDKAANYWRFHAERRIGFREDHDLKIFTFYTKWGPMIANEAFEIGEALAKTLVNETTTTRDSAGK